MFWLEGMNYYAKNLKYMSEVCAPIPTLEWTTANSIKLELGNVILREFAADSSAETVLIIPPQAGHHSCITDFDTGKSLVEAAMGNGIKSPYVADWKSATPDRKDETIDSFITSMRACIRAIGSPVTLIGLCQGGWQSAIYASLYPEDVRSLVLAGAPIDFHAGRSMISMCASHYPMTFFESMVAAGHGLLDGKFLLTGFKMLNAVERFYRDYADLYAHMDDSGYVKRYRKFRGWYEYTQKLPGAFYLQVVKDLFKENLLIQGRVKILGRYMDLKKINHPLYLIGGNKDDITPREQLFNIERYVSSKKITKLMVPAGHIGVFIGSDILKKYWSRIFESVAMPACA